MFTETRFEFMFSETLFNFMFTGLMSFGNTPFHKTHSYLEEIHRVAQAARNV